MQRHRDRRAEAPWRWQHCRGSTHSIHQDLISPTIFLVTLVPSYVPLVPAHPHLILRALPQRVLTLQRQCVPLTLPFFRNMAFSVIFRTTIDTCLLPARSVVYTCNTCNPGGIWHSLPCSALEHPMGVTITCVSRRGCLRYLPL